MVTPAAATAEVAASAAEVVVWLGEAADEEEEGAGVVVGEAAVVGEAEVVSVGRDG